MIKPASLIFLAITLTSCASSSENAKTLIDRLEFNPDESGCIDIRAQVDLNPAPIFSSNATVIYKKSKSVEGFSPPEC